MICMIWDNVAIMCRLCLKWLTHSQFVIYLMMVSLRYFCLHMMSTSLQLYLPIDFCQWELHNDEICDLQFNIPSCQFDGFDCKEPGNQEKNVVILTFKKKTCVCLDQILLSLWMQMFCLLDWEEQLVNNKTIKLFMVCYGC